MTEEKIDPQKFYEMQMLEEQIKATQQMVENSSEQLMTLQATIKEVKDFIFPKNLLISLKKN